MVSSTLASDTDLGGGLRAPSEASPDESHGQSQPSKGGGLARDAVRRLLRNKLAVAGGLVVIALCLVAIFADVLAPYAYTKTNFGRLNEGPSLDYPFGTDQLGRDVLSRIIYGARISMLVGVGAQIIIVLIGVPIGALSGSVAARPPPHPLPHAQFAFLRLARTPPTPSWGQMVGDGQQYLRSYWHLCVFPSIAIAVTMLAFTFLGDGVRDALDPKLQ